MEKTPSPFLCVGTTPTVQITMSFDHIEVDQVNRAKQVIRNASGKPINVGRALHTLGEQATVCVPIGGESGRYLKSEMDAAGIDNRCVEIAGATRTCITAIDRSQRTATELVEEHGPMTAAESALVTQTVQTLLPGRKMLILSGSLAPGVPESFYLDCCNAAAAAHVAVILDARGAAMKLAMTAKPMVVKPNRRELADTLGAPIDDDKTLRAAMIAVQRMGAQWVVITMGREGAMISDGKSFWRASAIPVEIVSPIGSGDAFTAGLAAGILHGKSVPEACRLATAAAAANVLIPGSGLLRWEDVQKLQPLAKVEIIS